MTTNGHRYDEAEAEPEINRMMENARFVNPELTGLPKLYNHCIDDLRPVKVICIGAGFSGILTGIRFPQRIENLDLTIYEKNEDVGGTWWENRQVISPSHWPHRGECVSLSRLCLPL
jgi:hypothetical protein